MIEVEVDQSGKIEDLAVDTALAFANGEQRAILIAATVKRAGLKLLRMRRTPPRTCYLRMLAAGFCLLLRDSLNQLAYVTIDVEFAGREEDLRGMLLVLIRRESPGFPNERLTSRRIGKQSPAHHAALETFRRRAKAWKTVTERELLGALK